LRNVADAGAGAGVGRPLRNVLTVELDRPAIRPQLANDASEGRRFANAVPTHQAEHFLARHLKLHAAENPAATDRCFDLLKA
jgi:hypothetical protein